MKIQRLRYRTLGCKNLHICGIWIILCKFGLKMYVCPDIFPKCVFTYLLSFASLLYALSLSSPSHLHHQHNILSSIVDMSKSNCPWKRFDFWLFLGRMLHQVRGQGGTLIHNTHTHTHTNAQVHKYTHIQMYKCRSKQVHHYRTVMWHTFNVFCSFLSSIRY